MFYVQEPRPLLQHPSLGFGAIVLYSSQNSPRTNFSPSGLRHFEERGIVSPSYGRDGTYHSFDLPDVARLLERRNYRECGCGAAEIANLLFPVKRPGNETRCEPAVGYAAHRQFVDAPPSLASSVFLHPVRLILTPFEEDLATLTAVMREKALVSEESAFTHRVCTLCESSGELSCGVSVVGLGAAGLMAALAATDGRARVIAIDSLGNFEGTTNTHTAGA